MLRTTLSVVAGYLALFLFVMITFTLLWMGLGQERSFQAGTTEVTATWLTFSLPLSVLAAVVGGIVTAWVAGSRALHAVLGLAGLVLLLGIASAFGTADGATGDGEAAAPPPGEMSAFEAAGQARQPPWVAWTLPILGAAGVVAGGALVRRRRSHRGAAIQAKASRPEA